MAPVDQLPPAMERAELVEGVVGAVVHHQPIGVVETTHRRGHVEQGVVGVAVRLGLGDCLLCKRSQAGVQSFSPCVLRIVAGRH